MLIVQEAKDKTVPLAMSQLSPSRKVCNLIELPNVEHRLVPWSAQAIGYEDRVTARLRDVLE